MVLNLVATAKSIEGNFHRRELDVLHHPALLYRCMCTIRRQTRIMYQANTHITVRVVKKKTQALIMCSSLPGGSLSTAPMTELIEELIIAYRSSYYVDGPGSWQIYQNDEGSGLVHIEVCSFARLPTPPLWGTRVAPCAIHLLVLQPAFSTVPRHPPEKRKDALLVNPDSCE